MATPVDASLKRLYLSGIPADQNNVQTLSNDLKKFGTISKMIIAYGDDPTAALVTFSSHKEANAAMNSQQPVLGNQDIEVRWGVKATKNPPQKSSSSPSSPSSSSPKATYQCPKCTKILSSKQTLRNHMRCLHTTFDCPECHQVFESANEFRKHYNESHSDSKDSIHRTADTKESVWADAHNNANFIHLNETVTSLRRKNASLKKKLKKYKKDKSKALHQLQNQLVKLLEGQSQ